jgi:hypothetical protein
MNIQHMDPEAKPLWVSTAWSAGLALPFLTSETPGLAPLDTGPSDCTRSVGCHLRSRNWEVVWAFLRTGIAYNVKRTGHRLEKIGECQLWNKSPPEPHIACLALTRVVGLAYVESGWRWGFSNLAQRSANEKASYYSSAHSSLLARGLCNFPLNARLGAGHPGSPYIRPIFGFAGGDMIDLHWADRRTLANHKPKACNCLGKVEATKLFLISFAHTSLSHPQLSLLCEIPFFLSDHPFRAHSDPIHDWPDTKCNYLAHGPYLMALSHS